MSRKDYLREWQKLNEYVLTREEGENAVLTKSVFQTTSEAATVFHVELTSKSDYLLDTNDGIDNKDFSDIDDELDYPPISKNEDTHEYENAIEVKMWEELRIWYGKHNASREGINELLKIMRFYDLPLPLGARTPLK